MHRLLWTCAFLLGAAWLLPLHVLPWMSWYNEILAMFALIGGCAAALALRAPAGQPGVAIPRLSMLPLLIAGVALLQWLAGRIAYTGSLLTIAAHAALCIGAAAAGYAAAGERTSDSPVAALRILALLLLSAALVQVAVVLGQTFSLWMGSDWIARTADPTRGGGNVAQPNQAALLFVFGMASAFYLRQLRVLGVAPWALLMVILSGGLAITESRSGLLAFALLLGWTLWRRRSLRVPLPWAAAWGYGALTVLLFVLWPALVGAYWDLPDQKVSLTSSGRVGMWWQLLGAVGLRPWFGWGVMQVAQAQNAIAHQHGEVLAATFSHNLFIDLALWIGIPGMLLASGLAAAWLWPRIRAAVTPDAWFCVALLAAAAIQSMTEFPYAYGYILVPVLFAVGVLDAKVGGGIPWRMPRPAVAAILAVWAAGTLWSAVEYLRIEEDFRVARFEALRVGRTPADYQPPRTHVLTQLDALLRATRVKPRPGMPAEELALLRNVAMLHPWGATNFRYATALALNGQLDEAARQLQVLRALQGPEAFGRLMQSLDEMAAEYPMLKQLRQP